MISKKQILDKIEKINLEDELPENLIEQEVNILTQGMKDEDVKKNKKDLEKEAKKRIKTGLLLNEFGEKNKINVSEQEMQAEIQKQLRMMPGQENIVKEYYEKNPSALASMKGSIYEEKIINEIKKKGIANKKEITKDEAEKILKTENEKQLKENEKLHSHSHDHEDKNNIKKTKPIKNKPAAKPGKVSNKNNKKIKKVSKK